jgi:hypothetical protein
LRETNGLAAFGALIQLQASERRRNRQDGFVWQKCTSGSPFFGANDEQLSTKLGLLWHHTRGVKLGRTVKKWVWFAALPQGLGSFRIGAYNPSVSPGSTVELVVRLSTLFRY